MHESNKVEMEKRILEVSGMLLSGLSTREILHFASQNWGISERQTKTYIRRCYTLWRRDFKKKRKAGLDYHLAKREVLYNKNFKRGDFNACLEIAKDEARLEGLYVERKEVGTPGSFAEWVKAVKEEKERRRKKNSNSNR